MKKNIITNKITPCCNLPFSVIYWWVSNLTLNSEADREFIISKISQGGTITIDGWKVLINSGTLESDASLTKSEFLAWFYCGRQPNCEQLKVIIEAYQLGVLLPPEIPENIATIDGKNKDGNTFTKEQIINLVTSNFGGDLLISEIPNTQNPIWYFAKEVGIYPNADNLEVLPNTFTILSYDGENWAKVESVFITDNEFVDGVDYGLKIQKHSGFYIDSTNGNKGAVGGYSATEFINIADVSNFEINPNNYNQFAYYDKQKQFLSGVVFGAKKVMKPNSAYYVRFTVKDGEAFVFKPFKKGVVSNVENKINTEFSNNGFYINATNGSKESLSFYSYSDFIPVKAGDVVRYKLNGWELPDPKHLTFFDIKQKYLFGNTNSETNTVSQDGFIVFSTETELFGKTVLTINNADLSLKNGNPLLLQRKNLKGFAMINFCTVSKDGGGDFKTINEAVEFGKNLGTEKEKFIIYLMPGIYIEHVNIAPYYIDIIGFDREKCIIQTNNGDYYNVPLNVSGRNSGSNFTAYATNSENNTPTIWAYGIHCDHEGAGRSVWNNCNFISTVNAGVGLGTQNNQQYEFINCRIENLGTNYNGGGLYMHNSPYANHRQMSVWVENCVISTKLTKSVIIDDANANAGHNDDDGTIFTFINNNCWSEINGKNANSIQFSNAPTTGDVGQIKLGLRSFGNNVNKINK